MKALYCQDCGDIIAPHQTAHVPRWCRCGRHALWWDDPARGILHLHDKYGESGRYDRRTGPRAYVLGMTNSWLQFPGTLTREDYVAICASHPDYYMFSPRHMNSVAIRIRPGETGDTRWKPFPEGYARNVNSLASEFDIKTIQTLGAALRNFAPDLADELTKRWEAVLAKIDPSDTPPPEAQPE